MSSKKYFAVKKENISSLRKEYSSVEIPSEIPEFSSVEDIKSFFLPLHKTMKDLENRFRTASLFFETRNSTNDIYPTFFTTREQDHTARNLTNTGLQTYISFKRLYMMYDHIPGHEYEMALDIFGSWDHWLAICKSTTFKEYVEKLQEELSIKLRSQAIRSLISLSKSSSPAGAGAARYLADEGYIPKKLGRISKEEKLRQTKIAAGVRDDLKLDMERLGIEIVSGGKQ